MDQLLRNCRESESHIYKTPDCIRILGNLSLNESGKMINLCDSSACMTASGVVLPVVCFTGILACTLAVKTIWRERASCVYQCLLALFIVETLELISVSLIYIPLVYCETGLCLIHRYTVLVFRAIRQWCYGMAICTCVIISVDRYRAMSSMGYSDPTFYLELRRTRRMLISAAIFAGVITIVDTLEVRVDDYGNLVKTEMMMSDQYKLGMSLFKLTLGLATFLILLVSNAMVVRKIVTDFLLHPSKLLTVSIICVTIVLSFVVTNGVPSLCYILKLSKPTFNYNSCATYALVIQNLGPIIDSVIYCGVISVRHALEDRGWTIRDFINIMVLMRLRRALSRAIQFVRKKAAVGQNNPSTQGTVQGGIESGKAEVKGRAGEAPNRVSKSHSLQCARCTCEGMGGGGSSKNTTETISAGLALSIPVHKTDTLANIHYTSRRELPLSSRSGDVLRNEYENGRDMIVAENTMMGTPAVSAELHDRRIGLEAVSNEVNVTGIRSARSAPSILVQTEIKRDKRLTTIRYASYRMISDKA